MRAAERAGLALVALPLLAVLALLVGTTGAQEGRPDMVTSENVKFLHHFPTAADGVGARVVGNRLFVTTTKDLEVYDITDPPNPVRLGAINANISFENEEVPTNGKLLGISGQYGGCQPAGGPVPPVVAARNCLVIYDVSDGAAPKVVSVVPNAGDHTHTCVLDCKYFYGSSGTIVDASDPANAKVLYKEDGTTKVNWHEPIGKLDQGCHHQNEIRPGVIAAACQPIVVMSINAEDGGSVTQPKILQRYRHEPEPREDPPYYSNGPGDEPIRRFIHGVRWPNGGHDKFALVGGETNFQPRCTDRVGKFSIMDTTKPSPQGDWTQTDQIWPQNGTYDTASGGNGTVQALGCSVHWFEEHPTFKNGGLLALAEYEQGTRFFQVTPEGRLIQTGYALPIGGSTSAPHWAPDGRTVYVADYTRGLDVLSYEGPLYVPDEQGKAPEAPEAVAPGEKPAEQLKAEASQSPSTPAAVTCPSTAGFSRVSARGEKITVVRRQQRPFTVELFRQSKGRRVVDRRVARLKVNKSSVSLPGGAKPGFYFARIRMVLPGTDDVRRVALRRQGRRWSVRPDHYLRTSCGPVKAFKLERTVFGGRKRVPLRIAYRVPAGVGSVTIDVMRGTKVLKSIVGDTRRAQAHRYVVPASIAKPGTDVRVRLTVERARARVVQTLVSRRL
jgi:hypothetical protein